jgi:F-type H+-transporting ATPase subunit beta
MPSAVGYQPTLSTEMGELQERITSTAQGRDHLRAGHLRARRRPDRPRPRHGLRHLDAFVVLERGIAEKGIFPAVDPLASTSTILDPASRRAALQGRQQVQQILQRYKDLQDIIAILGVDELSEEDKLRSSPAPARSSASCRSRSTSPRSSRASPASTPASKDTIDSFERLCDGEGDDLPESAFMYVGTLDDARAKAEKAAAESLNAFIAQRGRSIEYLRGLEAPDWTMMHTHPTFGSMRAGDLLAAWSAHDVLHTRQIVKRLFQFTSRDARGFSTDYAGTWLA